MGWSDLHGAAGDAVGDLHMENVVACTLNMEPRHGFMSFVVSVAKCITPSKELGNTDKE